MVARKGTLVLARVKHNDHCDRNFLEQRPCPTRTGGPFFASRPGSFLASAEAGDASSSFSGALTAVTSVPLTSRNKGTHQIANFFIVPVPHSSSLTSPSPPRGRGGV